MTATSGVGVRDAALTASCSLLGVSVISRTGDSNPAVKI